MSRASIANFLPDEALAFRSIGSAAVTATTASTPMDLQKLQAYWSTDEWGIADKLTVVIQVNDVFFGEYVGAEIPETYTLSLQVDALSSFASPTTVASIAITADDLVGSYIELAIDPADMREFDATANYVRLVATLAGEAPSLEYCAYVKN